MVEKKSKATSPKTKTDKASSNMLALQSENVQGFEEQLSKIEKQLNAIVVKQTSGVSPEFSALMDGYVNKANESQEYKVKHDHLESLYEELKQESKNQIEENKKLKSALEASQEALRMSESDLKRTKQEAHQIKVSSEDQVHALVEEREQLRNKQKQLLAQVEKLNQDYNNLKSELLEQKYKSKQLEQEKQVEVEAHKRSTRENAKFIEELKEKLDLRTREVEYKDALLNQLIKQVSTDDAYLNAVHGNSQDETKIKGYELQSETVAREQEPKQSSRMRLDLDDDITGSGEGPYWGNFKS